MKTTYYIIPTATSTPGEPLSQVRVKTEHDDGSTTDNSVCVVTPQKHGQEKLVASLIADSLNSVPTLRATQAKLVGLLEYIKTSTECDIARNVAQEALELVEAQQ